MNNNRIQLLRQFIEEQPDDPFNVYALAMEYRNEQPAESWKCLKKLLDEHPTYLPTYYQAADLCTELNNRSEAEAIYQRGIELAREQKNEKALLELNRAYRAFQDDDDEW
ncbi:tetratricopeptide repeat protein [Larkinella terrae]|uniref:Tetratricopeptide repeat protein n=1 Tax=Larkinella terrae TaxID=2025311 RepID=A0A7K0ELN8_9BACT|nr:tetratricopeptide repeat protein [Larkinella terrae]MRS62763.1 tetratricopeptide repeat protein [Larkinella terrae]